MQQPHKLALPPRTGLRQHVFDVESDGVDADAQQIGYFPHASVLKQELRDIRLRAAEAVETADKKTVRYGRMVRIYDEDDRARDRRYKNLHNLVVRQWRNDHLERPFTGRTFDE